MSNSLPAAGTLGVAVSETGESRAAKDTSARTTGVGFQAVLLPPILVRAVRVARVAKQRVLRPFASIRVH
mgnify:CR=1 FL=1